MRKYTNPNPSFSEEIDIYEETDPVDAETVDNVPLKELQDNLLWLKKNGTDNVATDEEMEALIEHLKAETPSPSPGPGEDIATDEEVEEMIENLPDL